MLMALFVATCTKST